MKNLTLISILLLGLILFPSSLSQQYVVGVSPPSLNLGELERGETKISNFLIVTPSPQPLIVDINPMNGDIDLFLRGFKNLVQNFSEEECKSWVKIFKSPLELMPSNQTGGIRGKTEVKFALTVPLDAEPGYHMLLIEPLPRIAGGPTGQVGTVIRAVTPITVVFRVKGNALRDGRILDITSDSSNGRTFIKIHFLNTGNVSITATASEIRVYQAGRNLANFTSYSALVKPNSIQVFQVPVDLNYGDYEVYAKVDYTTGYAEKTSIVSIVPPPPKPVEIKYPLPYFNLIYLILIILIIVICYAYYKKKGE